MSEINEILNTKDPDFKYYETALWADHMVKNAVTDSAMEEAEKRLEALSVDSRKKAFEHDTLQLAKDVASVAKLFAACEKSQRTERLKKVAHVRSQNAIGGNIVDAFMGQHACHRAGTEKDLLNLTEQACFTLRIAMLEYMKRSKLL